MSRSVTRSELSPAGIITTVARLETAGAIQDPLLIPSLTQTDACHIWLFAKWTISETMFGKTPHSMVMKQSDDLRS